MFKMVLSEQVTGEVSGFVRNGQALEKFDFTIEGDRVKVDEITDESSPVTVGELLMKKLKNWAGVYDEHGKEIQFSKEALKLALNICGMASAMYQSLLKASGVEAKAKN